MSAEGVADLEPEGGCLAQVVEFDFETKVDRVVPFEDAVPAMQAGKFVWIDLDVRDVVVGRERLAVLGAIDEVIVEDALTSEAATRHARYEACLHVVVAGCRQRGLNFDLERVDIVLGQSFMATIHRGPVLFLNAVRRDYRPTSCASPKLPAI